jgi:cytoskeletal protein CcmA (bactofilin family)
MCSMDSGRVTPARSSPSDGGPTASGEVGDRPRPNELIALLGRGTEFDGKLYFEGAVRVDGTFRGDIRGEDTLIVGEGAYIEGKIEVATCIVTAGEVRADIRARDSIELYPPAKVIGALHAPAIFIDRGVQFEGTCTMAPLPPRESPHPSPIVPEDLGGSDETGEGSTA